MVLGGELVPGDILQTWRREGLRLLNVYGPTECTIFFTCTDLQDDPANIGIPHWGAAHIVNPGDTSVLIGTPGVPGELLIEGPPVARCYLNDPVRSSKNFIAPPPWCPRRSSRFYLTGDLVEWCPDGSLRILGRKDTQLKIRGQRVELAEISHHFLAKTHLFRDICVQYDVSNKRHSLVAFVVPIAVTLQRESHLKPTKSMTDAQRQDLLDACEALRLIIPSFMIPTLFVPVDSIPLTPNGKIDRKRLSEILCALTEAELGALMLAQQHFEPLQTPGEILLSNTIADELGIDVANIGRKDGFVQLGGDSLKAMKIISSLRRQGKQISNSQLLMETTIQNLAQLLTNYEIPTLSGGSPVPAPLSLLHPSTQRLGIKAHVANALGVPVEAVQDVFPCSALQEGFLAISAKNVRANISRLVFELDENIDLTCFKTAWDTTVSELGILRTRFVVTGTEGPLQAVIDEPIEWTMAQDFEQYMKFDETSPMVMAKPMVRLALCKRGTTQAKSRFVMTINHAIYDLFTLRLILDTFQAAYCGETLPPTLPFSVAVAHLRATEASHMSFWQTELENSPESTWPSASSSITSQRCTHSLRLEVPQLLAWKRNVTLATYIQTAWAMLLSAYEGTDDVVFGVVVSGRESEFFDAAAVAGPMLTTCPLRLAVDQTSSVTQLLHSTQQAALRVSSHAQFGLQHIAKIGESHRRACSFQTLLVVQPDLSAVATPNVQMRLDTNMTQDETIGAYGLVLECAIRKDHINLVAEYDPGAVSAVELLLKRFAQTINNMVNCDPSIRPPQLLLLPEESKRPLIPSHEAHMGVIYHCIHDRVLQTAQMSPEKVGIRGWDGEFTYEDIERLSRGLAHKLRRCGVTTGTLVPLCAQKSVWVVIGMLAVFRAGGTLVPLDTESPPARLREVLGQIQPTVMLVSGGDIARWGQDVNIVLPIDLTITDLEKGREQDSELPSVPPTTPAYCIFTSGTTGQPKGVLVEHCAYVTAALRRVDGIARDGDSRVLQFSSFAFDTSIEDICTTLMVGGMVIMPSEDERKNDLHGAINRYDVNTADITPSVANLLDPEKIPGLAVLILGGEAPTEALLERWRGHPVHVVNSYGPSECSIVSTLTSASYEEPYNMGRVTCGRAWVTHPENPHIRMPLGAVGELLLEGPMLARGYYQMPEATAAAFLTKMPWAASPAARFYRTGDIVRANEDGSFTFVRRREGGLVKLRGNRIEFGDIEAKIISIGTFNDICVDIVTIGDRQTLVAFYTEAAGDSTPSTIQTTLQQLRTILPSYMVPDMFLPLELLPVTISGKRDRRALQTMFRNVPHSSIDKYRRMAHLQATAQPRNAKKNVAMERMMAALWAQALGTREDSIAPESNFFELGGDSVVAMRLSAMCRERGLHISVTDIFRCPTLSDLASVAKADAARPTISEAKSISLPAPFSLLGSWSQQVKILAAVAAALPEVNVEDVYPCTPFQEAIMTLSSRHNGAYIALHRFHVASTADWGHVERACDAVVFGNPILRTRIVQIDGSGYFQVVLSPEASRSCITKETSFQIHQPGTPNSILSQFVLRKDLSELWWYASHAVFDGFSVDLVAEQLKEAHYSSGGTQKEGGIPFNVFVARLRQSNETESHEFWSRQLSTAKRTELFEAHLPSPPRKEERLQVRFASLGRVGASGGTGVRITNAVFLQAAWALVLSRYSSSSAVVFGLVQSGRSLAMAGIERIVGPCVTTVPYFTHVNTNSYLDAWLGSLQELSTEMGPHEHYGLTRIAEINSEACRLDSILNIISGQAVSARNGNGVGDGIIEFLASETAQNGAAGYDTTPLTVQVLPETGEVMATFDASYVPRLLVEGMIHSFAYVYEQLNDASHGVKVGDVDLCSRWEREMIHKWNYTDTPLAWDTTALQLISTQRNIDPTKLAIEAWDGTLTYEDVERHSSSLALYIGQHRGLSTDDEVIPICFSRSKWVPVVMLAIQKTRRAYAALDPTHPTARLLQLCKQVKANVVIVDEKQALHFSGIDCIVLNKALVDSLVSMAPAGLSIIRPADPAMVVFTSGSTGTPKAILIQQGALACAIQGFGPRMDFSRNTRTLQNASFAFDIHACEIFLTLAHGGCLIISDADTSQLVSTARDNDVNWLFMTPSTVSQLLHGPGDLPSVRTLMMIGETPTQDLVSKWASSLHLINAYGPAENTLFSTLASIISPSDEAANIGTGVNTLTWVVDPDDHDKLMPVGCVGELLLQGSQLAREYLHQPEETAERFIPPPAWSRYFPQLTSGERLYKTGDLVSYTSSDGSLRFVDRKDSQTKLNGQRIELGEITSHLSHHLPSFNSTAEVIKPLGGPPVLAAFIALRRFDMDTSDDVGTVLTDLPPHLRQEVWSCLSILKVNLPSFMVPSVFIPVSRIPQTKSAKLDRKVLRDLVSDVSFEILDSLVSLSGRQVTSKEPPVTESEKRLQGLWANVLNMPITNIGLYDSFFSLGGDSIRAIRLTTLLAENTRREIRPQVFQVFQQPVLKDMAKLLREDEEESTRAGTTAFNPSAMVSTPPMDLLPDTPHDHQDLLQQVAEDLGLEAAAVQDIYPCTPLQEAMIAASAQSQDAYMAEHVWSLPTSTDVLRLEEAWSVAKRHFDILRTTFITHPRYGTLQVVTKPELQEKAFQSSRGLTEAQCFSILEFFQAPEKTESRITWRAHHAIFDAWSFGMIVDSVETIYAQKPLPEMLQFKSFVRHIVEARDNPRSSSTSGSWWTNYLDGAAATPFPVKTQDINEHQRVRMKISTGPAHEVTTATIVRAAWALILTEYCGTDDVVFGATLSGRNADMAGIESVCGPTATTVPVRIKACKTEQLASFLRRVQMDAVGMMPHENIGIQNIKKLSEDARAACDFQNLLVVQPSQEATVSYSAMQPVEDDSPGLRYHTLPLVVEITLDGASSVLEATFDTKSIDPGQMRRVLHHLDWVIQQLCSLPSTAVLSDINHLTECDRLEIQRWNYHEPELVDDFIDEFIARQARRTPNGQAVCSHDGELTYTQLESMSQRLAARLADEYGVIRGDIVPLCFEKSLWAMVAMMAVLKTGAAFAPMDPAHPAARLQTIMDQFPQKVVLASVHTQKLISSLTRATVACVDQNSLDGVPAASRAASNQRMSTLGRDTADLAYVIFTSGSTGLPKGVMIPHRAFCSGVKPRGVPLGRSIRSRVLQFASYSFDTSLEDTLTTWFFGGCVCIPSDHERLNDLEGAINRMRVNCAHITPTLAHELVPARVPTLRQLRLGGERMTASNLESWTRDRGFDLRNAYGPTETSITATVTEALAPDADPSNIGFPVACRVWVTDQERDDRLAPIGCAGELLVEGPLLSAGYLNDAQKTAESFITNPPWAREPGRTRRFYKTGDIVQYADDGSLVYLGRKDSQVKVKGNRVEIGDVESHLRTILAGRVEDVAAEVIVPYNSTQAILVAFLALGPGYEDDPGLDLRSISAETRAALAHASHGCSDRMRSVVPSYMVPAAYVPLRALPRSIAGKTDRRALGSLIARLDVHAIRSLQVSDISASVPRPRLTSPTERALQELWAQVLSLEADQIQPEDTFVGLGGDSILALRLVQAAKQQRLGSRPLTVADVLRPISLKKLASSLLHETTPEDAQVFESEAESVSTVPIATPSRESDGGAHEPDEPLVKLSQRLGIPTAYIEAVEPATSFQRMCFEASMLDSRGCINTLQFTFDGHIQHHRMQHVFERLIARHSGLRTVFTEHNGRLWQVVLRYHIQEDPRLKVIVANEDDYNQITDAILPATGHGSLMMQGTALIRPGDTQPWRLVICVSHALYDGPGYATICQELGDMCAGRPLAPSVPQFHDFTRSVLEALPPEHSRRYWTTLLQGSSVTRFREYARPRHRSAVASAERGRVCVTAHDLRTGLAATGFTFASLLKAAWAAVLARACGTADVVFGTVVTTRGLVDWATDDMVGPAIEMIPVRCQLGGWGTSPEISKAARALLHKVQEQYLDGLAHHALGLHDIFLRCTDWSLPSSAPHFGSVIQHQNLEKRPSRVDFGDGVQAALAIEVGTYDPCDLWLLSTPLGEHDITIDINYDQDVLASEFVHMLAYDTVAELHRLRFALLNADGSSSA